MPFSFKPTYRRIMLIDRKIRSGEYPNASTLADEWEMGVRTIMRDLEFLREELGAPLAYSAKRRGFYYENKNWFLPAVMVSEGEILGILLGSQLLQAYEGTPVAKDLKRLFKKIEAMLPEKVEIRPEHIQASISFCNPPSRKLNAGIWMTVLRGVIHQRVLTITYRSPASGKDKEHVLHPYHVLNLEGEWYLLAHNERHETVSQFAIPRIKSAKLSARTFTVPASFSVKDTLATRFGRYLHHGEKKEPTLVKLLIAPELAPWASEKAWHPNQKMIRRKGGALELHIPVANTRDIESWILSLGEHVRVLGPEGLMKAVKVRHMRAVHKRARTLT